MKKKWKNLSALKKIGIVLILIIVVLLVVELIGYDSGAPKPLSNVEATQQLDKSITAKMLVENPGAYKGKVVELTGKVFNVDKKDGTNAWQVWTNPENSEGNVIIYYSGPSDIGEDDYIKFIGQVSDVLSGENAFGGKVNAPTIYANSISKIDRDEAVAPAIKTIDLNKSQEKEGLKITLDKIEFGNNETRLYVTVENNLSTSASFYSFDTKLIQNGSQIKDKTILEDTKDIPSDIVAHTKESGKLYYEKADSSQPLTISLKGYSEKSYNELNYSFTVK